MSTKSKGATQKQQRICGYAIQLCDPLCMFFGEDVYTLGDLKFVLRLIHLCKSDKHSSKPKTPSLCIRKPPNVHCSNKSTPTKTNKTIFGQCLKMEMERVVRSSERSKEKKRSISRRLGKYMKEQKGRVYIIRRCVVMLLCWHD
ncbi:hypothetical protein Bca101_033509 [Brassica carinata]